MLQNPERQRLACLPAFRATELEMPAAAAAAREPRGAEIIDSRAHRRYIVHRGKAEERARGSGAFRLASGGGCRHVVWLDRVLAVPLVGIRIRPNWGLGAEFPVVLGPLIEGLATRGHQVPEVATAAPFVISLPMASGFALELRHDGLLVQYQPKPKVQSIAGRLPKVETGEIGPYSKLLDEEIEILQAAIALLRGKIAPLRFGFVAQVVLDPTLLPPGVGEFLAQLRRSCSGVAEGKVRLVAALSSQPDWEDYCHHTVSFDDTDRDKSVALTLDWQRSSKGTRVMELARLAEAREGAMAYFERFAEGAMTNVPPDR